VAKSTTFERCEEQERAKRASRYREFRQIGKVSRYRHQPPCGKSVLKLKSPRIRITDYFEALVEDMLSAARGQGLEGIVAKRRDSRYEVGKRTGSWASYRLNSGQELVIGGYIPGAHGVDAIVVGYYRGEDLIYVARVRNGFVPASRRQVFARQALNHLKMSVRQSSRDA